MNDKDKEAFEKWWIEFVKKDLGLNVKAIPDHKIEKAWQAACEYKDKEINDDEELLRNHMNSIGYRELKKLQAENKKLREALEFYANEKNQIAPIYPHDGRNRPGADFTAPYRLDSGNRAREALKELSEK